jgi:hypothetical protein
MEGPKFGAMFGGQSEQSSLIRASENDMATKNALPKERHMRF